MGKHLKMENWFDRTSTGTWKRKRVSARAEAFFPQAERRVLQAHGPVRLCAVLVKVNGWTLAKAWACVKTKVNTPPGLVKQPFLE